MARAVRAASARGARGAEWGDWMRRLGRFVRHVRVFLGLSQEELAQLAGVSQGAVSRLEGGRGLATPLLVVMRVLYAMRRAAGAVDAELLTEEARRLLGTDPPYAPQFAPVAPRIGPLLKDPGLEELVRLYRALSPRGRQRLVTTVRTVAAALEDTAGVRGEPPASRRTRSPRLPR